MNRRFHSTGPVAERRGPLTLIVGLLFPALVGCPPPVGSEGPNGGTSGATGGAPTAGTGGGAGGMAGSTTPCDAPRRVFIPSCGGAECHADGSPYGSFAIPDAELTLIGKEPINNMGCAENSLINPTLPPDGALFKRLTGTSCGQRMPAAMGNMNPPPPPDYLECITSWATSKLPPP